MAGRPRGAWADKAWRDALRLAVMRRATEADLKPKNKLDELAIALITAAKTGDIPALKELGDRLDGKSTTTIEATITERYVIRAPLTPQDADEWRSAHGPH